MIYKLYWGFITLLYAPFFKKISFPSHIGVPIFSLGLSRVTINKRVRIFPGMRIETHNQGSITFEEGVSIGQNFHITSGANLVIGKNTTILGNVFITNIDHEYEQIGKHVMEQGMIIKQTTIGSNCFIGYAAAIQAGTTLGDNCIVGASSVVRGDFPAYSVIVGTPGRIVKKYNLETGKWVRV